MLFAWFAARGEWASGSKEDEQRLRYHLLPLPHSLSLTGKMILKPEDISVILRKNAGDIEKNAFSILTRFIEDRVGITPSGNAFKIIVGVFDENGDVDGVKVENAERLKGFPNNDQAYLIQPINRDALVVTGRDEKGVYYGVRTLCQLLTPFLARDKAEIPLVKIEDWPDLAERGLWHGHGYEIAKELSAIKLNYVDYVAQPLPVKRNLKTGIVFIDRKILDDCYLNAINCSSMVYHLNFVLAQAYTAYPELAGKGDGALPAMNPRDPRSGAERRCPCASKQDILRNILEGWFEGMAAGGAREVTVWTTEFYAQCGCPDCVREGQFYLEIKAMLAAWGKIREKYPNVKTRIVISMRTDDARMAKVLAQVPKDVRIARICYVGHRESVPRDLFVDPQFDAFAEKGAWMSCYELPPMRNLKFLASPYKDFTSSLMKRGWRGGAVLLNTENARFNWESNKLNISALAEWLWNNNGRDIKEFAMAYATINRYREPDKFARWAEIMAPIEYDLYGSGEPFLLGYWFSEIKQMIMARKRGPSGQLGHGFFRYFPAKESFDEKIARCEDALAVANALNMPELTLETQLNICSLRAAKTTDRLMTCLEQNVIDKKALRTCVETFGRLADERASLFNARQRLFPPELFAAFMVEAHKAGKDYVRAFSTFLNSEFADALKK